MFVVRRGQWAGFYSGDRGVREFFWLGAGSGGIFLWLAGSGEIFSVGSWQWGDFWWGAGSGEIFQWGAGGRLRTAFTLPSKIFFVLKILLNGIFTCKTPLFTMSRN